MRWGYLPLAGESRTIELALAADFGGRGGGNGADDVVGVGAATCVGPAAGVGVVFAPWKYTIGSLRITWLPWLITSELDVTV